jgi:hypothetical protein
MRFNPTGSLNVAVDASDLQDGDLVRCKNMRIDQQGLAKTRDGSAKLNSSAINTEMWWLEEMAGSRYAFSGTDIYEDESSIDSDVTSAQWAAIQYNSFNDSTKQIFALNGTDRKRITSGVVNEWGIAAPETAPTLGIGSGEGLTGQYNAKYTYVRKVGTALVAESNPSPAADTAQVLANQSLSVGFTQSSDSQVTHARLYRTLAGGSLYYIDIEIPVNITYTHGYVQDWESDDAYIAGDGYKFTIADSTHGTENCFTWEELFLDRDDEDSSDEPNYDPRDQIPWWKFPV